MIPSDREAQPQLSALLSEARQYLDQFLEITRAQTALITAEDIDPLTENLELRAQILDKIDALSPELNRLTAAYQARPADAAIEDLRRQISRILKEINEIDHKNQAAARERMEFFQAEMRRAGETRKGVGAYLMSAEVFTAEFVDERQ